MSEPRFREIQLTSKQLVFLFMASVVVAVSIFLLGVSVGRGVRGTMQAAAVEPAATQPSTLDVPARMPPATQTTPADLSYHARLQGQTPPPPQSAAASTPGPAPAEAAAKPEPGPPPASSQSQPAPAPTRAAAPPVTPPAPAGGGWFVQTDAFTARGSADKRAAELKSKGHTAFVMLPGPPFRVRIGPFAGRAEADRAAAQMRAEGLKPSVTR